MPYYLVEEHTAKPYGGAESIPYHVVVFGKDEKQAFRTANQQSMKTRTRKLLGGPRLKTESAEFLFSDSELVEYIPGYLWAAADDSDIWYEVRFIGTVTQMNVAPPEEYITTGEQEEDETMPSPDPAPYRGVGLAQPTQIHTGESKGEVHGRTP